MDKVEEKGEINAEEGGEVIHWADLCKTSPPITNVSNRSPPITDVCNRSPHITDVCNRSPPITDVCNRSPPITDVCNRSSPITDVCNRSPPITDVCNRSPPITDVCNRSPPITNVCNRSPITDVCNRSPPITDVSNRSPIADVTLVILIQMYNSSVCVADVVMMLRRRQLLVVSLSCTSLLFLLVFGGSRTPRDPAPPNGGPNIGALRQLNSETWSGGDQLPWRRQTSAQLNSANPPLEPQSSSIRQSLVPLSSTQNEPTESLPRFRNQSTELSSKQFVSLQEDQPPSTRSSNTGSRESWRGKSIENSPSRNSSINFNVLSSRVTSNENNKENPPTAVSSSAGAARIASSEVAGARTFIDSSPALSLGQADNSTGGVVVYKSSEYQAPSNSKRLRKPINVGQMHNEIDSDIFNFDGSFIESNSIDSGPRRSKITTANHQTGSERKAVSYEKKPLISNPKMYHYVPKMNAKTWAMAYPQLVRSGVNTASYRVNFEYRNYPGNLHFTPGGVVSKDKVKRILVLTTWRSGSTFLGDIFNAYPGTFYSFEPLHQLLQKQHLEDGPLKKPVLKLLRDIMTCNMSQQDGFFDYVKNKTFLISHNSRYWQSCSMNRALCFDANFYNKVCEVMPVNVIKTVRMGAGPVEELLADPSLDLRVIHLVRDPRGTMHSRLKLEWCRAPVCRDPNVVCDHLFFDLKCSESLQAKYPDRFLLVRYEDLGTQPEAMTSLILEFVGLPSTTSVKNFIAEHTTLENRRRADALKNGGEQKRRKGRRRKPTNAYSTFRNSRTTTFAWRNALNYSVVADIQDACIKPMRLLNLRIFNTELEYRNDNLTILLPENR
ncbi:Sulfotransferase domain [Trinorchestia longiramus]|nr:Sulfotransferase domain [Trinorchestia longiramus]